MTMTINLLDPGGSVARVTHLQDMRLADVSAYCRGGYSTYMAKTILDNAAVPTPTAGRIAILPGFPPQVPGTLQTVSEARHPSGK